MATNKLLDMCKKLRLPLALIRWIRYFLSDRYLQLKFNNQTQELERVKVSIPQGSPISPILFLIYIRDICRPRPNTFSFSYMDDICLGASATSTTKLKEILKATTKSILLDAKASAVEFEIDKTELLYASRKRDLLQQSIQVGKQTIKPSQLVRWLGFFLDSKFTYKEYVYRTPTFRGQRKVDFYRFFI